MGMPNEEWCPILSYEGLYSVSNQGKVRRDSPRPGSKIWQTGNILKAWVVGAGYLQVALSKAGQVKRHYIHHLVANMFLTPVPGCNEINHLDGVKQNNNAANLEWTTRSGNNRHARNLGLNNSTPPLLRGEQCPWAKITAADVQLIRELRHKEIQLTLAKRFGISTTQISRIQTFKRWRE